MLTTGSEGKLKEASQAETTYMNNEDDKKFQLHQFIKHDARTILALEEELSMETVFAEFERKHPERCLQLQKLILTRRNLQDRSD